MGRALLGRGELRLGLAFFAVAGCDAAVGGAFGTWLPFALPVAALVVAWPWLGRTRAAPALLDWLPFPLVILTYEMLHALVPAVRPGSLLDPTLEAADRALLGDHAGVLLEPLVTRPLTVLLACAYASYYVLPAALAVRWWRRDRRAFRELMVGETGALFVGYLGYLFLPALGPHAALPPSTFGVPLEGDFIGAAIRSLNGAHGGAFPRDAFPSLHTANAVTLVLMAWRHERRTLAVCAPLAAGIVAATVYLRFHYVMDVLAGAALAIAFQPVAVWIVRNEQAPGARLQSDAHPESER